MEGRAQTGASEPVPCLEVVAGNKRGRVFALDRVRAYVIGRLPGAEIHIDDHGVSRRHVRVTRCVDGTIEAADMRSTNGLFVNGERRERAVLTEGDLLSLGPDANLRLRWLTSAEQALGTDHALGRAATGDDAKPWPVEVESEQTLRSETALLGLLDDEDEGEGEDEDEGEDEGEGAGAGARSRATPRLSARQLEVSRLVARGLTNAAIAEQLGISTRTVTTHLDHIYSRLGIGSRAVLTRWLAERGLSEP